MGNLGAKLIIINAKIKDRVNFSTKLIQIWHDVKLESKINPNLGRTISLDAK